MASPLDLVAVVLVALAAAGSVVMVVVPAFGRRYGGFVALAGVGGAVSGAIAGRLPALLGALLVLAVGGFWLVDRGIPLNRRRPWWLIVLAVVLLAVCAAATVTVLLASPNVQ